MEPKLSADLDSKKRQLLALLMKEKGIDPRRAPISRVPRDRGGLPLSFAQERLWVIDQLEPGNIAYNLPTSLRLSGPLRAGVLERAFAEVVRRHEVLRTTYAAGPGGRPVQIPAPPGPMSIPIADLSALPAELREPEALHLAVEEGSRLFDLARGPVLRVRLLRLAADEHALLSTIHHIASDGWSNGLLVGELVTLYEAFSQGRPSPLPEPQLQYADYAAWQRTVLEGTALEESLAYWRRQLADTSVLELPTDRPRPAVQGTGGGSVARSLPGRLAEDLKALARQEGATLFMVVTAAFQALLSRLSGQTDLAVGTPVANRHRTEIEGILGFFVNTLVLRTDLSGDPSFRELLARVRRVSMEALAHGEVPFSKVVEDLRPERSLSHTPLFQVMCALGNAPGAEPEVSGLRFSAFEAEIDSAMFDLNLTVSEAPGALRLMLEHRSDLFDRTTAQRLLERYAGVLAAVAADPEVRLTGLPLLTGPEQHALLREWNDTADSIDPTDPTDRTDPTDLADLIAGQAARTPAAPAVVFAGRSFSFAEVHGHALGLARRLRALGIGPGDRVGICAERSPEMVAAVLGILEAGAAYVPLDPAYPAERLAWTLEDAGLAALLAQQGVLQRLPGLGTEVLLLQPLAHGAEHAPHGAGQVRRGVEHGLHEAERVRQGSVQSAHGAEHGRLTAEHGLQEAERQRRGVESDLHEAELQRLGAEHGLHGVERQRLGAELAYILYTSGSTGRPKGVAMVRGALANLLAWQGREALPGPAVTLQFASLGFDVSFQEILSTWVGGGTLVLVDEETRRDPFALLALLEQEKVERLFLPFVALRQLAEAAEVGGGGGALRDVVTAGEQLQITPAVARWLAERPGIRLHNHYGPTEAHAVTALTLRGEPGAWPPLPPIGRPLANVAIHLLDAAFQPVPVGVPGELCVGGVALARGYLDRPDLTAERFVPDPLGEEPGGRLYRTGDLTRWRTDGAIEYLGRRDHQVKIRGVRVEPGEVEAVLKEHPGLRQAVVLAVPEAGDGPGALRLVAWYLPRAEEPPSPANLRDFLQTRLPAAIVPSLFVPVEAFPLTPSGKVDRLTLARGEIFGETPAGPAAPAPPPRTQTEELLAGLWSSLLGIGNVGAEDNFFALGGHSLLATQLVSRVREVFRVEIPQRALFEEPTLAGLARAIEAAGEGPGAALLSPIERVPGDGPFPLSFAQERLWLVDRIEPGSAAYNMHAGLRLAGPLRPEVLAAVLGEIVRRHATLRTTYGTVDGAPVQVVAPPAPFVLPVVDLGALNLAEKSAEEEARRLAAEEALRPFDLERGPVLRALLIRLGSSLDHVLLCTMHHIASDGWSTGILVREVMLLYDAFSQGLASPLPELPVRYVDYASWQRRVLQGEVLEAALGYWRRQLAGVPVLDLPTDRPRPALPGAEGAAEPLVLPAATAEALKALGRREGATLFMALMAAFQALLCRYSGQTDVAVGTPVAGRDRTELEGLIGFFVNTLVVRTDLGGGPGFRELLARVRGVSLAAFAHQQVPFERLVGELNPERSLSHAPLFQVLLVLQNAPGSALEIPGLAAAGFDARGTAAKFDLTLSVADPGQELAGALEYRTALFDAATVRRLLGHFGVLLAGAVAEPDRPLSELPLLPEAERFQVLSEWSRGEAAFPEEEPLPVLFARQAEATPDAPALEEAGGERLTYRQLRDRVLRLAHRLRAQGVGPEVPVGIRLERSAGRVVAALAVVEAGGAYVPLDPAQPQERQALILEDSGARVVVTEKDLKDLKDTKDLKDFSLSLESLQSLVSLQSFAYAMYTSGSTGRPKGVLVPQRGIARLARWAREVGIGPGDTVLQLAPFAFDASTLEIWGALLNGARVVVPPPGTPSLEEIGEWVGRHGVTVLWLTAGLFHQMVDGPLEWLAPLRLLLAGGDALSVPHVRKALERLPGVRLVNGYGPTENTTFTCCHLMAGPQRFAASVPVGRPIAGTRVVVLDRSGRPVPVGVPGELCTGGAGLARGYLGRPDLTAAAFVPDPWAEEPGERLYRTGDLARFLPDGRLEHLGRIDRQVKIRGFRVEPGEVEAVLAAHPGVRECAVMVGEDAAGRRLVGCLVPRDPATAPDPAALRAWLGERLPDPMIPAAFLILDALPLTPNGKVDRAALARLTPGPARTGEHEAPRTPAEERLAALWADVLGLDRIGVHDDFFALGGHSLLATRLVSRVREAFGVELPLRALFEAPTVAALARRIEAGGEARVLPPVVPVPRTEPLPLSFAQQRLWLLDQLAPGGTAYNLPAGLRLLGPLRPDVLARVFAEVVRRHEALRTTFAVPAAGGDPVQVVAPPEPFPLPQVDLSALIGELREAALRDLAQREGGRPFDLVRGPVLRALLVRLGAGEHALLLTMHHIASDGWSMGVLVREVADLYAAFSQGLPSPLPELPVQYADYAVWQRRLLAEGAMEDALDWWRRQLGHVPVLELPTDRPRSASPSDAGDGEPLDLPAGLGAALNDLALRHGATLFMVVAAAFQSLLARYSGQDDIAVGTPVAGRQRMELEGLIGFFVNTLVLRTDLAGDPTFGELLDRVRGVALAAFAHQEVPFERLVEEVNPERSLQHTPLFQVMLALQNTPLGALEVPGLSFRPLETGGNAAKFDLTLTLGETGEGLAGTLEYRTALFDAATIRRLLGHFTNLLEAAAADPGRRLSELPLLSAPELRQILEEWAGPRAAFPIGDCLHERFAMQAAQTPGALAVTGEEESFTYGELEMRANRLALRLRRLGVGPESRVGLAAERSPALIVGLLAILKAGGAYVPLDPSYPEERLAWLLEDSQRGIAEPVLLTQAHLADRLPAQRGQLVLIEEWTEETGEEPPRSGVLPDNEAYVIYTSGSTGRPKGMVITHRNVARLFAATDAWCRFGPDDVWTLFHSYAFDFSVWEIWGALLHGGRLVVVPYWVSRSPEAFLDLLERERVTVLNQTPSAFRQLVNARGERSGEGLRLVIFGGEALDLAGLAPWFDRHGDAHPRLVNMYGITETTVHVTWRPVSQEDLAEPWRSPIGVPIPDLSVHVLDPVGRPAPAGVPGELHVGGAGLGRGYLGRPELTAQRFVPDPFSEAGARLYRSGDLARFRPDGGLDYLGRIDQQVKVRGFRIEPGEIEAALLQHPAVREAVVLAQEKEPGSRRLVACVAGEGTAGDLRAFLTGRLPDYMVPSAFVVLPALPLTPHGKVDRRALAALRPEAGADRAFEPPRTPQEEALAAIWATVLGVERVGRRDHFFDLGGHSLLATRLISRVRAELGVEVPLRALFEGPTLVEMARYLEDTKDGKDSKDVPPIIPVPRDAGPLPLSFAQERLWFLDQLDPGSPTLNMPVSLRLRQPLDEGALARALDAVVRRHESLRTTFASEGGRPFQRILPDLHVPLPVIDLRGLDPLVREREAERLAAEEAELPFDLASGPLLRARLVRLDAEERDLLLTVHHIVSDGWSLGLLRRELGLLYQSPEPLPALPVQYADYAVWQRRWITGEELEAQLAYWRGRLGAPLPVLDLPTDRPRPAAQTYRGAAVRRVVDAGLASRLAAFGRREGATLFMVLLAVFQALLSRLSGQDDVIVGTPVAGRVRAETEGLIGCFLNNLALRTDLSGDPTFRELLARARAMALEAYAHQDVPFERLLEELRPERDLSRTPVFQVFLNMLNLPADAGGLGGGEEEGLTPEVPSKFDLTIYAAETAEGLRLDFVYNADLFAPERIAGLADQLAGLLAQAADNPGQRIGEISLVTEAARAVLPDPSAPLEAAWHGTVSQALAASAARFPGKVAVSDGEEAWTWAELDSAAAGLARRLLAAGVRTGDVAAVWAHRNAALASAVLGASLAGAAVMILDPAYPPSRLADYIRTGRPRAWLAVPGAPAPPPEVDAALDELAPVRPQVAETGLESFPEIGPQDAAVLTFTSGSTGRPKGVIGRHGPLTAFYPWMAERFGLSADDRFGMLSALSHDPLQRDLFAPVWLGATLCVPDPERIGVPGYLADWVRRERITVLHLTPAMLEMLVGAAEEAPEGSRGMPSLRLAFVVGDLLKRSDVNRLQRLAPSLTCVNLYGSTETQRSVSFFVVNAAGREALPLGRGMEGVQLLILNRAGRLAGIGELGEIHLRSRQLARGYLGDPVLTAERFLPAEDGRLYRTGDLGRYLPDGNAEFAGRADLQVKIRGFRIEPGEIEAALARFPGVRRCAVIAAESRLVAYVVPEPGTALPATDLRAFLAERLPAYMVPADYVQLSALPLTRTGKLDRRALPAPERPAETGAAPRTPVEIRLADLWRELLGLEQIGIHASFFDLGGHSLLATQLLSRIRVAFGVELPLRAVFEQPTLAGMAGLLEAGAEANVVPQLVARPRREDPPLSFAQERLWFLHQVDPGGSAYNLYQALRLEGGFDETVLAAALREVVRRQEVLRTRLVTRGTRTVQIVDSVPATVMPVVDLTALPDGLREGEAGRLLRQEALRPFDLERGPVLRARLLRMGPAERRLLAAMHHVASDGWSMAVFLREMTALYSAFAAGRPSPLPELPVQYADFARWQREWLTGELLDREVSWWRSRLEGAPALLDLPLDRPRPALYTWRGGTRTRRLSPEASETLLRLGREQQATSFMAGLALFAALLLRHTNAEDLVIGTPIANRNRQEIEGLIGFFANTLALRIDLSGAPGFAGLLDRVREVALGAYTHQDVPFERLVDELAPERSLQHMPLFQVMLVVGAPPLAETADGDLRISVLKVEGEAAKIDLNLAIEDGPAGLGLTFGYNADLFYATTVERLLDHCEALLAEALADPERPLSGLPLLGEAERHQLLLGWNDTATAVPDLCLHELFEARSSEAPDAPAVLEGDAVLSYGELDARANRLAGHLRRLGVGPESRVGILLERSAGLIVGLLGILKAGGAWVPMDPAWPRERLALLSADAGIRLILTEERLLDLLARESAGLPASGVTPDGLAYVIYTSGSTGNPKGVMVPHRGVVSLILGMRGLIGAGPASRVLQVSSAAFDVSVFEVFAALANGAALCIAAEEERRDPALLAARITREGVSIALPTPALLSILPEPAVPCLVTIGVAGEACPAGLAERWSRGRRFLNCYGPTETTVYATVETAAGHEPGEPPIGRPIANTAVFVLDRSLQPVPLGVAGELCIGGIGLARGYLARPDTTAERFVPDPFGHPTDRSDPSDRSDSFGARLYRTGDLARQRPDGRIEFLGRIDRQVKVRGFRIEPGEIESVLLRHPKVTAAVVEAREDAAGDRALVAWVAAASVPPEDELRGLLEAALPAYMVPSAFVVLPALPLTPSGKVDRKALPAPGRLGGGGPVPPRNALERLLAELWEEILGVEQAGVHDDFFALGGTSIKAAVLANLLEERLGGRVPVMALFAAPTIARLAVDLEKRLEQLQKARLEESRPAVAASPLVCLQPGGPGRPFFCVHPGGGNVVCYAGLARELAPDRPVYGLQSVGLDGGEPQRTVEEMAATYLEEVVAVQPQGPWLLGGWSLGGLVAYEMARQLRERGGKVELLVVIDSAAPGRVLEWEPRTDLSGTDDADLVLSHIVRELDAAAGEALEAAAREELSGLSPEERLEGVLAAAKRFGVLPADLGTDQVRTLLRVYRINTEAARRYRPQPYAGRTLLVRASRGPAVYDPSLGWDGLLTGPREVLDAEGEHHSLMQGAALRGLAPELRRRLTKERD